MQTAGMTEEEFIKYLSSNGVSIFNFDDEEEFLEEMNIVLRVIVKKERVVPEHFHLLRQQPC